jgi:hypothetical protein
MIDVKGTMPDEQDKIGGSLDLAISMPENPSEKRHRYPCNLCTRFNSSACDECKCDACQVPEDKCPKCKNRPTDILSQYHILHGVPQKGENWERADYFTCTVCGGLWKLPWEQLPKYETCRHCRTVFYCYPYSRSIYKGTLRGAHRPGLNWEKEDIFRCSACGGYFYVKQALLPGYHDCGCGRRYYCYRSTEEKRLSVDRIKKRMPFIR